MQPCSPITSPDKKIFDIDNAGGMPRSAALLRHCASIQSSLSRQIRSALTDQRSKRCSSTNSGERRPSRGATLNMKFAARRLPPPSMFFATIFGPTGNKLAHVPSDHRALEIISSANTVADIQIDSLPGKECLRCAHRRRPIALVIPHATSSTIFIAQRLIPPSNPICRTTLPHFSKSLRIRSRNTSDGPPTEIRPCSPSRPPTSGSVRMPIDLLVELQRDVRRQSLRREIIPRRVGFEFRDRSPPIVGTFGRGRAAAWPSRSR